MSEKRRSALEEMLIWAKYEEDKWQALFEACREFSEKVSEFVRHLENLQEEEVED